MTNVLKANVLLFWSFRSLSDAVETILENGVVKCVSERSTVNFTGDGEYSPLSERTLYATSNYEKYYEHLFLLFCIQVLTFFLVK